MSIVDNAAERADWQGVTSRLTTELQVLDTRIWIAMLDSTSSQAIALMIATQQLAAAKKALQAAATAIRGMS